MNQDVGIAGADPADAICVAAQGFAAVGSEPRLAVLIALVRAGPGGLSVGEIQARLGTPASTLTHHLKFLAAAGLIIQSKQGRTIQNFADFDRIKELASFLLEQCCADIEKGPPDDSSR
jgi:ArsR family transcriptional regulator, arsenate/arsenite/antimonite-responsive transcriptional repressor